MKGFLYMNSEENIERFEALAGKIKRSGIDNLMTFIREKSDFYTAPASTRYHMSCEGGLLQHSLNVYDCLMAKKQNSIWKDILNKVPDESLIIISLFHDLCKVNFYVQGTKNQKTYDEDKVNAAEKWQVKHDSLGNFIWETVLRYEVEDNLPLGHGEKSAILLSYFIKLSKTELLAIRWHMGFSEDGANYNSVGKAMELCPIVLALHEADMEASKIIEGTDCNKVTILEG